MDQYNFIVSITTSNKSQDRPFAIDIALVVTRELIDVFVAKHISVTIQHSRSTGC